MSANIYNDLCKVNQNGRSLPHGADRGKAPYADLLHGQALDPRMATTLVDGVVAMFAGKAPSGCRPQLLAFRVSITRSLRGMGLSEQDAHRQAEIIEHRASEELHWIWQGISFEPEHAAEGR